MLILHPVYFSFSPNGLRSHSLIACGISVGIHVKLCPHPLVHYPLLLACVFEIVFSAYQNDALVTRRLCFVFYSLILWPFLTSFLCSLNLLLAFLRYWYKYVLTWCKPLAFLGRNEIWNTYVLWIWIGRSCLFMCWAIHRLVERSLQIKVDDHYINEF